MAVYLLIVVWIDEVKGSRVGVKRRVAIWLIILLDQFEVAFALV